MPFCPNCGTPLDGSLPRPEPEPEAVTLARINAERDVKVAQISARQERDWNESREAIAEVEAEAAVEVAAAEAEVIGEIIAAETADPPEAEPLPEPVVVEAPAPAPELSDAPPVVEHHEPRVPRSRGWWDGYS